MKLTAPLPLFLMRLPFRNQVLAALLCLWVPMADGGWGAAHAAEAPAKLELRDGDRVVFVGDALIEQEQHSGWIELMLTTRFADRAVTFRNLGWSGDTPAGASREGLSLLQAGREPAGEGWTQLVKQLEDAKPTVAFIGYGMASSFDGAAGLERFRSEYARLLDALVKISPGVRLVLVGPNRHEALGSPWVDPAAHNAQLAAYSAAIQQLAAARGAVFVPLFDAMPAPAAKPAASGGALTDNGIQLNATGYRVAAQAMEERLFGNAGAWRESAQAEPLRQAILRKNEWFFHRSRPANMAYIFGFRKKEQGNNAVEVPKFDAMIADEEQRIAQLRTLRLGVVAPEPALRVGNLTAKHTEQPHPNFTVAEGFEVTLWAENPLLHKPIQMNFDPRGRLWVASSEVYPQIEPGQAATDKIIVLEDTTGAGHADKATVFADGLLIPTGLEVGDGGVYVAQSTELLHFKDTDGDGKADVRRTVLSGFGTEDTHHNLHTLRWGLDGLLYMDQSVYTRTNAETPTGVVRLKAGGIFRFDPRNEKMEILYRGWVNAWGHQFDDYGQSFVTDGAGGQGLSWAIPGATYLTLAPARRTLQSVSPGSYPKFCGLEIIRSAQFPDDWQGDAITCDFRAHRVVHFKIAEQGAGYLTTEMPDLLRSTDVTFRPLDVKLGPDGALYLADWSNPIIQHGEVDFRDPRRDKEHGRIWRIAAKGRPALARVDLTKLATPALLGKLTGPNGYDRERSKRVLVERGASAVRPDLDAWAKTLPAADERARLNALWMYQSLTLPQPALLTSLLAATDARVRAAAVRVLSDAPELAALEKLVADEHPRVRLEAVRALGKIPKARAAEVALSVLDRPMDPFLDYALWLTINELAEPWLAAVKSGAWVVAGHEKQLEFGLKAVEPMLASDVLGQLIGGKSIPRDGSGPWIELIGAAGRGSELQQMLAQLVRNGFDDAAAVRALAALAEAARLRGAKAHGDLATFVALFDSPNDQIRTGALQLAGAWKLAGFTPQLLRSAGDAALPPAERSVAFAALREIGGAGTVKALKELAGRAPSPVVRRETVLALASLDLAAALPDVIATLKATTGEADAQALWRGLLAIRGAAARLAVELTKAGVSKEVALAGLRPAREGSQNQALVTALLGLAGLKLSEVQLSAAELQAMAREALLKGDPVRGERVYRRAEAACMACHSIGGVGGKVGPDLTSIGASAQPDYLVESLLYPNAKVKEGYHSILISTKDGQEQSGTVIREGENEVVLRNAANQEVSVATKNIAKRTDVGSLMPAGLIDPMLPEERFDLIKFLSVLGKPGEFDAAKGGVARAWRLYRVTAKNQNAGIDQVVRGDPALTEWVPVSALVNGSLAKETVVGAYPTLAGTRGLYAATRFESAKGGSVKLTVTGDARALWINGRPVKPEPTVTVETKPGVNTIVFELDDAHVPAALRVASGEVSFATN